MLLPWVCTRFVYGLSFFCLFIHLYFQAVHIHFFFIISYFERFHMQTFVLQIIPFMISSVVIFFRWFLLFMRCFVVFSRWFLWINPQGFPPCTCIKKWSIEMQVQIHERVREWERQREHRRLNERRFNSRLMFACNVYVCMELRCFRLDLIVMAIAVVRNEYTCTF